MSTAIRIKDFLAENEAALQDEAGFVKKYPFPFLVRESTQTSVPFAGDRATTKLKPMGAAPIGDGFMQGDVYIHLLRPKDPDNFSGAVTLGRGEECDLVVQDGSISSLHGKFTIDFDDNDEKIFFVADAGSSNGTWVNGEQLDGEAPHAITDQDSVRFGPAVKFQFFTSEGFYEFLGFFRRIKQTP